jgi:hypothetical protein
MLTNKLSSACVGSIHRLYFTSGANAISSGTYINDTARFSELTASLYITPKIMLLLTSSSAFGNVSHFSIAGSNYAMMDRSTTEVLTVCNIRAICFSSDSTVHPSVIQAIPSAVLFYLVAKITASGCCMML